MSQYFFDFLDEVQKPGNFNALFPDERAMRLLLWLFAKVSTGAFPRGKFKESDIYNAYQETSRSGLSTRLPQEYINSTIGNLHEFFLLYNEQEQVYTFRDYGKNVCKNAEVALIGSFNPTNIEIICGELLRDLKQADTKPLLLQWLDLKFDVFEPKMSNQVDALDRKINVAVAEIRESAQLQQGEVLETLKKVDAYLERIRGYNKELRSAFSALKDIDAELAKHIVEADETSVLDKLNRVQEFFPEVRYRLDLIDRRLDKLQPRLRQFFGALNKPLFNTRVESFLRFLLSSSSIQTEGVKKSLELPAGIPPLCIYQPTSKFIIVEKKEDLFPTISRRRQVYEESPEKRKLAYAALNEKVRQQDDIETWAKRILDACKNEGAIDYTGYFMEMVDLQNGNIDLAARVTHRLLKIQAIGRDIRIDIDNEKTVTHKNITIWTTKIMHL